jgi:hypothetical protein
VKYPYLVSSLPTLALGEHPPLTAEAFYFQCTGALSKEDQEELRRVLDGRFAGCTGRFAVNWCSIDTQLRNKVAQVRASRRGVDVKSYIQQHPNYDVYIEQVVVDAFAKTNPLDRELVLDQARWYLLDQLALAEPFGLPAVLAFAVKLQIAERWMRINEGRGEPPLEEHVSTILNPEKAEAT